MPPRQRPAARGRPWTLAHREGHPALRPSHELSLLRSVHVRPKHPLRLGLVVDAFEMSTSQPPCAHHSRHLRNSRRQRNIEGRPQRASAAHLCLVDGAELDAVRPQLETRSDLGHGMQTHRRVGTGSADCRARRQRQRNSGGRRVCRGVARFCDNRRDEGEAPRRPPTSFKSTCFPSCLNT